MAVARVCPSADVLESLLLGQVAGPEADALERHLEQCEHCLRAAAVVRAEDHLVATARQVEKSPIEAPFGELVEGLIQRCAHLSHAQDTQVDPAATTSPLLESSDLEEPAIPFLSLPQGPGEIGRLGTYRVLQVLGRGGMGVVFLAEDTQLGRLVALKVIRPGLAAGKEARERFLREARAAAAVKHDHVVTIYQVGEERGTPFLAMEYLEGETLDARLRRQGPLPFDELLRIGREIAEGLAAAHLRSVTHRHIKPSNIWLEERAESRSRRPHPRVKILDFGLARSLLDPRMTHSGHFMGTPAYMAPEQAQGRPVADRADLFSLGCVLHEMATGVSPFSQSDAMATLLALATFHPPLLIDRNEAMPAALSTLVKRLLAKDPKDRPTSAKEVAESLWEIERELSGTSTAAKSAPAKGGRNRLGRPSLRTTAMVAVVLLVVAGIVALSYRGNDWQSGWPSIHAPFANSPSPKLRSTVGTVDSLRREAISEQQLRIAGNGDPEKAPAELVAILGDGRLRHWDGVDEVAFSLDGKLLVSACGDHTVRLWDVSNGELVRNLVAGSVVLRVAFSPDSQILASGDADGTVVVWEVATGTARRSIRAHTGGRIWCLAFSDDGQRLASAGEDGKIRLWDASTGDELVTLSGHTGAVESLAFLPNSNALVSGGTDGGLRLWDLDDQNEPTTLRVVDGRVLSIAITRDGRRLAYGVLSERAPAVVKVLEATAKKTEWTDLYNLSAHPGDAVRLAFRPDGQVLACANHNNWVIRQWEMGTGRELQSLGGQRWGTSAVAFHPNGRWVASGGWDGTIRLWESSTGIEFLPRTGHESWVNGLAFSPDGLLATGSRDTKIKLWNLATGQEIRTLASHRGEITSLEFRRDGQLLASGSTDATMKLWDMNSSKLRTLAGHNSEVRCVAFNGDGGTIISGSADLTAKIWETDTSTEVLTLSGHTGHVNSVAWAPDYRTFATGSADGTVKIWEQATGLEIKHLAGHQSWIECVAYSKDGSMLATSSNDQTVRLWDPHTGDPIRTLTGHEALVHSVSFSPVAPMIASAAYDGTVRLWNLSDGSCRKVIRLASPGGRICRVVYSPDGRHLATANGNGTVYILRLAPPP
jgi:WD40 repeat protein/serine/threonine protein kinase